MSARRCRARDLPSTVEIRRRRDCHCEKTSAIEVARNVAKRLRTNQEKMALKTALQPFHSCGNKSAVASNFLPGSSLFTQVSPCLSLCPFPCRFPTQLWLLPVPAQRHRLPAASEEPATSSRIPAQRSRDGMLSPPNFRRGAQPD